MKLNECIQQSRGQHYQALAKTDFTSTTKNFFSKRVNGVVYVPLASIADAFMSVLHAMNELKLVVSDRKNYKTHLDNAANYIALATLFMGNAWVSPTINFINPNIFSAVLDATTAELENKHNEVNSRLVTVLTTKSAVSSLLPKIPTNENNPFNNNLRFPLRQLTTV